MKRRTLIALGGLALGTAPLRSQTSASLRPTPSDALGPYYPVDWSGEIDADLVDFRGQRYRAGIALLLEGRIRGTDSTPVAQALVEIWQTDATGKYRHPGDDGEGPAQRGFQGYGRTQTGAAGEYRFKTIKPVVYGGRPAHVHLKVVASGYRSLVTQMYFEGESTERSGFGGFSRERDRLTIRPEPDAATGGLRARFDLVLQNG